MADTGIQYRRDIDGLRALAILPVVLFHAEIPFVTGGFVGVDVFFVISGYLITSILLAEIRNGTFTFAGFYERRARRLLPTLFIVLAFTFGAGFVLMTPLDLRVLGQAMLATLVFGANFHYATRGGYFADNLTQDPLLHMWSLAVEEQFYLLWPLALLFLARRLPPRRLAALIVVLMALSLAAAEHGLAVRPFRIFFQPQGRFWELLTGALLATAVIPAPRLRPLAEIAAALGLALILYAIFAFSAATPFPGIAAIVPVAGAALIIYAGSGPSRTIVGRLLATPPLVFIGLISYAWYLWHWPLFAYFNYALERSPAPLETIALILASAVAATLCWRYLEVPYRRRTGGIPLQAVAAHTVIGSALLFALGGASIATSGFIARHPSEMRNFLPASISKGAPGAWDCGRLSAEQIRDNGPCLLSEGPQDAKRILVWGDSHATAVSGLFAKLGKSERARVEFAGRSACPPLFGIRMAEYDRRAKECTDFIAAIGNLLDAKPDRYTDIVLVARWNFHLNGPPSEGDDRNSRATLWIDEQSKAPSRAENEAVVRRSLERTARKLHKLGLNVWVLEQVPYSQRNVPRLLARRLMQGQSVRGVPGPATASHIEQSRNFAGLARDLASAGLVRPIDPTPQLCGPAHCLIEIDARPLYFDDDHISNAGADLLGPLIRPIFQPIGPPPTHAAPSR